PIALVPGWRVLNDTLKGFRPAMLHPQRHGIGKILFESIWRHALEPVSIHPVHEFLKTKHLNPRAGPFEAGGAELPAEEDDDEKSQNCADHQRAHRVDEIGNMEHLRSEIGKSD